jgi:hypothetical protein
MANLISLATLWFTCDKPKFENVASARRPNLLTTKTSPRKTEKRHGPWTYLRAALVCTLRVLVTYDSYWCPPLRAHEFTFGLHHLRLSITLFLVSENNRAPTGLLGAQESFTSEVVRIQHVFQPCTDIS